MLRFSEWSDLPKRPGKRTVRHMAMSRGRPRPLTDLEAKIVDHAYRGSHDAAIGKAVGMSPQGVRKVIARVFPPLPRHVRVGMLHSARRASTDAAAANREANAAASRRYQASLRDADPQAYARRMSAQSRAAMVRCWQDPECRAKYMAWNQSDAHRELKRRQMSAQHARGELAGKGGTCRWYDFTKKNGETVRVQGSWEYAFADWCERRGLDWTSHPNALSYTEAQGRPHLYFPDFYIRGGPVAALRGTYVETKNDYLIATEAEKFRWIRASNPNARIQVWGRTQLLALGVHLRPTDKPCNGGLLYTVPEDLPPSVYD
jgi:hypothetical protein